MVKDDDTDYDIGEPVAEVPPSNRPALKYGELWERVRAAKSGTWIPVTVVSHRAALRMTQRAKLRGMRAKQRGLTVYISNATL